MQAAHAKQRAAELLKATAFTAFSQELQHLKQLRHRRRAVGLLGGLSVQHALKQSFLHKR